MTTGKETTDSDGKPKWSHSKSVQEQAKRINRRAQELHQLATEDLEATKLLYQQDEPGFLQAEGPRERTFFMTQQALKPQVSLQAQNKMFSLQLERGPYRLDYTRNGRHMLCGGEGGEFASFDWQAGRLGCQVDLRATGEAGERVRDLCFLQNETMMAVAQANFVYIYDGRGVELHRLKKHTQVKSLQYLPYHFLLASVSEENLIRWQDVTSGKLAAEFRFAESGLGQSTDVCQNPWNAIINCAHANGIVSMWSPNLNKPLVRMSCHKGPVRSVAVNPKGMAMATAGLDGVVKLWDLRNNYKPLGEYRSMRPVVSLAFSQQDLLAAAFGAHVVVWKDTLLSHQDKPYMRHVVEGHSINKLAFCPFEDILGVGHSGGIDSLLIPGAGEPNYDVYEANPFANTRQRQEREVHALLDKLPMETISLDGGQFVGRVVKTAKETIEADRKLERTANRVRLVGDSDASDGEEEGNSADVKEKREKRRARGRSSAMRRYRRKRANVIDKYKEEAAEKARTETIHRNLGQSDDSQAGLTALNRFVSRAI